MSTVCVRPFRRADREQLTALVNAHVQAVMPGVSVSVNTVMSQLERDPGEFIVDPWVTERATLVAEQRGRVVAAAHLLRYGVGEEVGEGYRGTAEINWLLYWPRATHWLDSAEAAGALVDACLERLRSWGGTHWHADGALPAPAGRVQAMAGCRRCGGGYRWGGGCRSSPVVVKRPSGPRVSCQPPSWAAR